MSARPGPVPGCGDAELARHLAVIRAEAQRLRSSETWTRLDDELAAMSFERAARAALSAPLLLERSTLLRGIARRYVPEAAKPYLRRVAPVADRFLRRAVTRWLPAASR